MKKGFVYFAINKSQGNGLHTKIGRTSHLYNRLSSLNTSYSLHSIIFYMIILCDNIEQEKELEEFLHSEYIDDSTMNLENYENAGTEWFNRIFNKDEIQLLLNNNNFNNEIIDDKDKINDLFKSHYENQKKISQKYHQKMRELKNSRIKLIKPRDDQIPIINSIINHYSDNDKGQIILPPGMGKSLISLFSSNELKSNKICIGIPSLTLIKQWMKEIKKIYQNIPILAVCSNYCDVNITTNEKKIKRFLKENKKCIILTSYCSCNKLFKICQKLSYQFDFKVGDECHHLTGEITDDEDIQKYTKFLDIQSIKSLFMTGTSKTIENNTNKKISSMDNSNIFGNIIEERNIQWAIQKDIICDYKIVLLKNTIDEIQLIARKFQIDVNDSTLNLFLSAYMSLKSLLDCPISHLFCYTNNIKNAKIVNNYIKLLIDKSVFNIHKNDIYHQSLNSEDKFNIETEIDKFKNHKYGIISCVYLFGEGFNCPELNGTVFCENMTSEIRIIQSMTRCMRKFINFKDKQGYIILPFLDKDEWNDESESFQKIRNIIYHIRNNDSNINQKIIINHKNNNPDPEPKGPTRSKKIHYIDFDIDDIDDDSPLKKLKLRIRKSIDKNKSLQDEYYNFMKERNKNLNLKSKQEYLNSNNNNDYIQDPEKIFRNQWKNWYDFLGYDTSNFIQTKDEWINECKKNNLTLNNYFQFCEIDNRFPIDLSEFYLDFTNIENELNLNTRRRR
jgi:predicted helicase